MIDREAAGRVRLSTKILMLAALVILVTNAASIAVFYGFLTRTITESAQQQLAADAIIAGEPLRTTIVRLREDLRFLSRTPDVAEFVRSLDDPAERAAATNGCEGLFRSLAIERPDYDQIRLIDATPEGRELIRVDRQVEGGRVRLVPPEALQAKGGRDYMIEARDAGPLVLRVSRIELNREHGEIQQPLRPVVRATFGLPGEDGSLAAVLVINVELRSILEQIQGAAPHGGTSYLTDGAGHPLVHPDAQRGFAFEFGDRRTLWAEFEVGAPDVDSTHTRLLDGGGSQRFFARQPVVISEEHPERSAWVVLIRSAGPLHAEPRAAISKSALWLVVLTLVALGLGAVVIDRVTRPIVRISRQMAATDVERHFEPLPLPEAREARVVAVAFNQALARASEAREQLERANRDLESFAYVASHDLKEPARTVNSLAKFLSSRYRDEFDDRGRQALAYVEDASERMVALVRSVLDYSRLGRMGPRESISLSEVIGDVMEDLEPQVRAIGAEIEVGPMPVIEGCRPELTMLFQNLITNAIRYRNPDQSLRVVVEAQTDQRTGRHTVWVRDNGQGVPTALRERVFEMFRRGHTQRDTEGIGIGLAHCRRIVELHGGTIVFEDPGDATGAVVRIEFADGVDAGGVMFSSDGGRGA